MTPEQMEHIHAAAFTDTRAWSADEFAALLDASTVTVFAEGNGFAITRTMAGESELLTLAVRPENQRQGLGHKIITRWLKTVPAQEAFLEVAADNIGAVALYESHGFATVARRSAYYARKNGTTVDAIVMRIALPQGQRG